MPKYEAQIDGSLIAFVDHLDRQMCAYNSAVIVDGFARELSDAIVVARVYERAGAMAGNRVAVSVMVIDNGGVLDVHAIASGGSNAVFKRYQMGQRTFLSEVRSAVESFDQESRRRSA